IRSVHTEPHTFSLHDALPICGRGIVAAAAEHVLADHLDDVDRWRGECDLFAGFQAFRVATGLQADVAFAEQAVGEDAGGGVDRQDRKSTRLNSSHVKISYAVF